MNRRPMSNSATPEKYTQNSAVKGNNFMSHKPSNVREFEDMAKNLSKPKYIKRNARPSLKRGPA